MVEESETENFSRSVITVEPQKKSVLPADFETAIGAAKFGKFNILLMLSALPSIMFNQFEFSSMSFVLPVAQCDLNLTLENKGLLNAILYAGMILSSFLWGSAIDVVGRKKILILSHLLDAIIVVMAGFSYNFSMLLAAKLMGGFLLNGPLSALPPYLCEFHGKNYRSRIPLIVGFLYNLLNAFLPFVAWSVLSLDIKLKISDGFEFHAWNLFLLTGVIPALLSGLLFILMPETPKYLMTKQKNEEALYIFRKIYALNTGSPKQNYPINKLIEEKQINIQGETSILKNAWTQISPLFSQKHVPKLTVVCIQQLLLMLCNNTLRMWLPQLFQAINDYQYFNNKTEGFCNMLSVLGETTNSKMCNVNSNNTSVYINTMIVGALVCCGYIATAFFVNMLGKKRILGILGIVGGLSISSLYFAQDSITVIALICVNLICVSVGIDTVITVIIDLFPTSLRASALSMALMCGRIGALVGNLLFPLLLQINCATPFATLGIAMIGCSIISLLLPNTDLKALE